MSLRNELRPPNGDPSLAAASYGWKDWYLNIESAAKVINSANNVVLIFFSGLNYDNDMSPIPTAGNVGNNTHFHKSDFTFSNKLVLELHNYDTGATSCSSLESSLYSAGFDALDTSNPDIVNVMPVVMTEWGHLQNSSMWQSIYSQCLNRYLPKQKAGWMMWVVTGSYYIRSGTQDGDESWGELLSILALVGHHWQCNAS
jgi:Cellulase (glycosyl hydrolase family 5)